MPVNRRSRLVRYGICLCLAAAPLPVTISRPASAQGSLPEWGRPLTPAEGRALRQELTQLSNRLGVREGTLTAIARILGTNLRDVSFAELVQQVRVQAQRAAELQQQIGALRTEIAALTDRAIRDPARTALERATAAFDQGNLEEADLHFAALESLRQSESSSARTAWVDAVEARARIAELRLDFDNAESLRLTAAREERLVSTERQWRLVMGAALARYAQGTLRGDLNALERAALLIREQAMPLANRTDFPLQWASSQVILGNVLQRIGERVTDTAVLEQAISAFEAALTEFTPDRHRIDWARSQNNIAVALTALGSRETGTARLERAVLILQTVLAAYSREREPVDWARAQNNLGDALRSLGERENGTLRFEQAAQAYAAARAEFQRADMRFETTTAQNNVGSILLRLGEGEAGTERLMEAETAFLEALRTIDRNEMPFQWAVSQMNLATTRMLIGEREPGIARLQQAVSDGDLALQAISRDSMPIYWATAVLNRANALAVIAERTQDNRSLEDAERQAKAARAILAAARDDPGIEWADEVLADIAALRGRRGE